MTMRKLTSMLLALTLVLTLTSCGKSKSYEPPEWVAGFHFAQESARVLRLITESGADDASLAELQTLTDHAGALPYYYFSNAYAGPDKSALSDHATTARLLFQMMLDTQKNAWSWADVSAQAAIYFETLGATDAPDADARWLPRFERTPESDPLYAVLACFFRAKHNAEQKEDIVTVTLGGNTVFGQTEGAEGAKSFHAEFSKREGDLAFPLRLTSLYLRNDTLSVLNCAAAFTNATEASGENTRRGSPGYAGIFPAGGVEAVSVANEHADGYFDVGLRDTQKNLGNAGVVHFGDGKLAVTQAGGVSFGLLGYNFVQGPPEDLQALLSGDISAAREQGAELVLLSFHWGEAASTAPTQAQIDAAHLAVDLGADMVVGHHPHALQGMEIYNGKTIAYSLGDFAVDEATAALSKGHGALLRQPFQRNEDGSFTPLTPMLLPVLISPATGTDFTPRPAFGDVSGHIVRLMFKNSRPLAFGVKELASVG